MAKRSVRVRVSVSVYVRVYRPWPEIIGKNGVYIDGELKTPVESPVAGPGLSFTPQPDCLLIVYWPLLYSST